MDQSDWMEYLGRREQLRVEDLKIEQGDGSRRLNQEELGKAWAMKSPGILRDVLPWAKGDNVVRQIMDARSPSPTPFSRGAKLPSPPSSNVSVDEAATTPLLTFDNPTTPLQKLPPYINVQDSQASCAQQQLQQEVKAKNISRSRLTKPSRAGRTMTTNAKIRKSEQKPAMGTRSRNLTRFYQLDLSGFATMQRCY